MTHLPKAQVLGEAQHEGIVPDEQKEDVFKKLDGLTEFFKELRSQSNKLVGGGIGPEDFADGP